MQVSYVLFHRELVAVIDSNSSDTHIGCRADCCEHNTSCEHYVHHMPNMHYQQPHVQRSFITLCNMLCYTGCCSACKACAASLPMSISSTNCCDNVDNTVQIDSAYHRRVIFSQLLKLSSKCLFAISCCSNSISSSIQTTGAHTAREPITCTELFNLLTNNNSSTRVTKSQ
jgi:hypothetical protein